MLYVHELNSDCMKIIMFLLLVFHLQNVKNVNCEWTAGGHVVYDLGNCIRRIKYQVDLRMFQASILVAEFL